MGYRIVAGAGIAEAAMVFPWITAGVGIVDRAVEVEETGTREVGVGTGAAGVGVGAGADGVGVGVGAGGLRGV